MSPLSHIQKVESNARTYAATFQRMFVSGHGIHVRDSDGKEYIDCLSNAGSLPVGHNHPEVRDAVISYILSDGIQQALDLTTPAKYAFVKELFSKLPKDFSDHAKIHFCSPCGSDAVEAAIKLTKFYTRRNTILAFHGGYHGMTAGALAAMGNVLNKSGLGDINQGVHFAPFPYRFRCPFGTDGEETEKLTINYIRTLLSDPESGIPKPAAILVEPIQGEGGCVPASVSWMQALRELTIEFNVLLIIDEVQTGFGRTGTMFAFEKAGIKPDVVVLSKAVGGGYPLAVIVYDERLDIWPSGHHAGTFRGNQIAMVAGRETMRIIEHESLDKSATTKGQLFRKGLETLTNRFPFLGDVRGRGLMIGVEVVKPRDGHVLWSDGALAKIIKLRCFENGLIIETGGRNSAVLRFLPPLILSEQDINEVLERFEKACVETEHGYRSLEVIP